MQTSFKKSFETIGDKIAVLTHNSMAIASFISAWWLSKVNNDYNDVVLNLKGVDGNITSYTMPSAYAIENRIAKQDATVGSYVVSLFPRTGLTIPYNAYKANDVTYITMPQATGSISIECGKDDIYHKTIIIKSLVIPLSLASSSSNGIKVLPSADDNEYSNYDTVPYISLAKNYDPSTQTYTQDIMIEVLPKSAVVSLSPFVYIGSN